MVDGVLVNYMSTPARVGKDGVVVSPPRLRVEPTRVNNSQYVINRTVFAHSKIGNTVNNSPVNDFGFMGGMCTHKVFYSPQGGRYDASNTSDTAVFDDMETLEEFNKHVMGDVRQYHSSSGDVDAATFAAMMLYQCAQVFTIDHGTLQSVLRRDTEYYDYLDPALSHGLTLVETLCGVEQGYIGEVIEQLGYNSMWSDPNEPWVTTLHIIVTFMSMGYPVGGTVGLLRGCVSLPEQIKALHTNPVGMGQLLSVTGDMFFRLPLWAQQACRDVLMVHNSRGFVRATGVNPVFFVGYFVSWLTWSIEIRGEHHTLKMVKNGGRLHDALISAWGRYATRISGGVDTIEQPSAVFMVDWGRKDPNIMFPWHDNSDFAANMEAHWETPIEQLDDPNMRAVAALLLGMDTKIRKEFPVHVPYPNTSVLVGHTELTMGELIERFSVLWQNTAVFIVCVYALCLRDIGDSGVFLPYSILESLHGDIV